jgi:prepilin-type N-terminal cleavage/methylation domain-containing protein
MRKKVLGFTLIELMIVIAIIAIIAAIAIPGLLRARMAANEGNASASMRSLTSAQEQFKKSTSVDQDLDGNGEYGLFAELTGVNNRRACNDDDGDGIINVTPGGLPRLQGVTDLSMALATVNADAACPCGDYSSKSGYFLKIWLPGDGDTVDDLFMGGVVHTTTLSQELGNDDAIEQQEIRWICYAWPATYRTSGVRAFCVDNQAEVFMAGNTDDSNEPYFDGEDCCPIYSTAMSTVFGTSDPTNWEPICVKDKMNTSDSNQQWIPNQS